MSWKINPQSQIELGKRMTKLGGISAIHVSDKGKRFVFVSDKGKYFEGNLLRDSNSKLLDIEISVAGMLKDSKGNILTGRNIDSESIAVDKNKNYFISYESNNRIMKHKKLYAASEFLPKHIDFNQFHYNKGIEAIALNENGNLIAIPEEPPKEKIDYPIYVFENGKWNILTYFPSYKKFQITDVAFLPDGSLITLERKFKWSAGFKSQLRRLKIKQKKISKVEILMETDWSEHNFEGLSIWQDNNGHTWITIISDNNFLPNIKTQIREFKLTEKK